MDRYIKDFYKQSSDGASRGHFYKVVALHETASVDWETVKQSVPALCKGWYELAHLKNQDRLEFIYDFWVSKMPYRADFQKFLNRFFGSVKEIGIFLTQKRFDDPFDVNLVYSLKNETGFFRGSPPLSEEGVLQLQQAFPQLIFPEDYLSFLQIHNGFCKTTDSTGIISSEELLLTYQKFQALVQDNEPIMTGHQILVDPKKLVPFYESFGMPFFQCFWADWYPQQEMGNVYFSGNLKTISDVSKSDASTETMAFPTFTDWLIFYLEQVI